MTDFGDELTHWMTVRQIGVRALARRSGYSTGFISQLCSGKRNPSPDTGQNLDDALAAGGRVAALVPRPLRRGATSSPNSPEAPRARNQLAEVAAIFSAAVDGPLPAGAFSEQEYGQLVQALSNWAMQMKRRDLLAILGAAATAAYASPLLERLNPDEAERLALAASQTHRADEAIIGHISAVLNHCMRQEDTLGPQVVLETVYAQRHLVRSLLPAATADPLRAQMMSLLANINRFTGWVLFNLNDFAGAQHYYTEARHVAHEADDDAMCSLVLANWSQLATWSGDPRLGVEHALGAVAWGQRAGSKLLVSYARDVGARAYSAVVRRSGKRNQRPDQGHCMESLDLAHRGLVDAPDGDPGSTLVYFYDDGIHLTTRIGCLLDSGVRQGGVLTGPGDGRGADV
jgi:transcriptional regulator with XRE-family HTH domain